MAEAAHARTGAAVAAAAGAAVAPLALATALGAARGVPVGAVAVGPPRHLAQRALLRETQPQTSEAPLKEYTHRSMI